MMKITLILSVLVAAISSLSYAQTPAETSAFAQRGNRLLVVGILGTTTDKPAALSNTAGNQIIELDSGKRTSIPSLPISATFTQAAWLDDETAFIFARVKNDSGSPESLWLGRLSVKTNRFTALTVPPAFAAISATYSQTDGRNLITKLIGASQDTAWFIAEDGQFTSINSKSGVLTTLPNLLRKRVDFVSRVLSNGRVVVAGGQVESEMVLTRERGCGAPTTPACVEKYTGFGQRLPSRRHEMYDPVTNTWRNSAPSRASGGSAAVLPSGRVAKLGDFTTSAIDPNDPKRKIETTTALLEISSEDGQSWRRIVLPTPMTGIFASIGLEAVAVAQGNNLLDRSLFLRATAGDDRAENPHLGSPKVPVWWWLADVDDAKPNWQLVNRDRDLGIAPKMAGAEKSKLHVWPSMNGVAVYVK